MHRMSAKCDHLKTGFEPQGLDASRCENCHMTSDVDICYTSRFVRFIQSFMDMYALSRTANSLEFRNGRLCSEPNKMRMVFRVNSHSYMEWRHAPKRVTHGSKIAKTERKRSTIFVPKWAVKDTIIDTLFMPSALTCEMISETARNPRSMQGGMLCFESQGLK